ncbi:MAG TPA: tRNA (N(6)-L-threonylcarbamoyladenosine(37)-C(2))-methylthiotransferase MtaB [Bacillota bacterium]|nr:tRNA (N(6)-L-threonylcarbamoyladenosine(37)-C(2))-methylthiotransferase MtaB [Bacillota bacterium]
MEVAPLKRVAFYTLGCKTNQYDTEAMQEQFQNENYAIVDFREIADFYIVNTCTVTSLSDKKSRQMIRRAHRNNPEAIIAVVGCYAQRAAQDLLDIPGVSVVLGTNDRMRIVEHVEKSFREKVPVNAVGDIMKVKDFEETPIGFHEGKTRAVLKIQEGCSQYCSYCIIPYARGPIRSRMPGDVLAEVERLTQNGFKEIVLTGIHIASYGKDLQGRVNLKDLLKEIHGIEGLERIRLGSLEPTLLTKEFVSSTRGMPKLCRHYHISLQSGCNATLQRMNRKYTTDQYRQIVDRLREAIPDVAITTDIMSGFPGETREEFETTLSFVRAMDFSRIHVFKYSPRQGTPAADFANQIPEQVKEDRSRQLIELGHRMEKSYLEHFIGKTENVLIEKMSLDKEGYCEGYTDHYIRVLTPSDGAIVNSLLPVNLKSISGNYIRGSVARS